MAVNLPVLEHLGVSDSFLKELWRAARDETVSRERRCPNCRRPMRQIKWQNNSAELLLDVCRHCLMVWFDKDELKQLPRKSPPIAERELSPTAREAVMNADLELLKESYIYADRPPASNWKKWLVYLGFPAEENDSPISKIPYFTWGLALICVITFILSLGDLNNVVSSYGFKSAMWHRLNGLTIITSFFLHGDIFHIVFNMYFPLVFGDNSEDKLGYWRFFLLVFLSHLAGILIGWGLFPDSRIPVIGASAGIAGIIGYYAVMFPKARIAMLWFRPGFMYHWFRFSIRTYIAFFIIGQLLGAFLNAGTFMITANLAHLAGIFVGIAWGLLSIENMNQNE